MILLAGPAKRFRPRRLGPFMADEGAWSAPPLLLAPPGVGVAEWSIPVPTALAGVTSGVWCRGSAAGCGLPPALRAGAAAAAMAAMTGFAGSEHVGVA